MATDTEIDNAIQTYLTEQCYGAGAQPDGLMIAAEAGWRLMRERLAAAEKRATDAEAIMEAFRKALVSIIMERYVRYDGHPDTPLHMVEQAYTALSGVPLTHDDIVAVDHWTREEAQAALAALTAPAAQPDERAAAERALAKKTCEWIRYRNLVDASARSGLLMVTDEAARTEKRLEVEVQVLVERLDALDATDGAAKEDV